MVSETTLVRFKDLYFRKFKINLSDEEATKQAVSLLNLMRVLTRPIKR